jgi:large repetitive protein
LDSSITIVDADSNSAANTTVKFDPATYVAGTDSLAYTGSNPLIDSNFNTLTGTLTLTGSASIEDYQAALRSVTFASTAALGVKTVSIVVTSDSVSSLAGLVAITVAALPVSANVPAVIGTTPVKVYTSGGTPVVLDSSITIVDADSSSATKATVKFDAATYDPTKDVLAYTGTNPLINGSYDVASGTLTLSGLASLTDYQAALRSVTFASTAALGVKTVSIIVTSDTQPSLAGLVAITVAALPTSGNVPAVIGTTPVNLYTSGGTPVTLDANVTIIDADSSTATKATVKFDPVTYDPTKDVLAYTGTNPLINGSYDVASGTLTLSGLASLTDYQAALRLVTFASTAALGAKTVSIAVTVLANQTPIIVGSLINPVPYTVGNLPAVLDPFVVLADDSTTIQGAKVKITLGKLAGDALGFTQPQGSSITSSYDSVNGILTLSGNGTVEQYQQALRSVTFSTSASGLIGVRTFAFEVTDQQGLTGTSLPFTAVVKANGIPLVTSSLVGINLNVLNNGPAAILDPGMLIVDDSSTLTGAIVTLGGLVIGGTDTVSFTPGNGITGVWNAGTKTLTLTGEATVAQYQTALRSVAFSTTGSILNLGVRTISYVVKDRQGLTSVSVPLTVVVVSVL